MHDKVYTYLSQLNDEDDPNFIIQLKKQMNLLFCSSADMFCFTVKFSTHPVPFRHSLKKPNLSTLTGMHLFA